MKSPSTYENVIAEIKSYPSPFYTNCPISVKLRLFVDVLDSRLLMGIRTEIKTLLLSPFDSVLGIPVEANKPLGCKKPLINLTRPAVLRVYFGVTKVCT